MSKIKEFNNDINIENKKIILRSDFNVPIVDQNIKDKTRIDLSIPFIKELVARKAKVYLISHLGRPNSKNEKNLSLEPIFRYLKEKIKSNIYFYSEKINKETVNKTSFLKNSEVLLFENIRFNKGEIDNDEEFAKNLSNLGDIYINDAFSSSHRKQASIHKITEYLKSTYAGPLLMKEIKSINMVLNNKKKPITCIIGGSKISTKIGVIISLIKKVDNLIIVGAMANNFIKFKGKKVGKSLLELGSEKIIKEIYNEAIKYNCEIVTPLDFGVSHSKDGEVKFKDLNNVTESEIILDIGPQTINKISKIIDTSKTVLWNGPAGYFENQNFSKGTVSIAKKISINTSSSTLISIVGGGDTISAIKNNALDLKFTHLSTAGGAFLEYIEGKNLPGVEVLK